MAKPSDQIQEKLKAFIEKDPELKKEIGLVQTTDELALLNSAMIQMILDWLDEKYPNE